MGGIEMASNKNGFFNKILNVIGIVDDGPREIEDDYAAYPRTSSARPSTYVPRQQRADAQDMRRADDRYQPARRSTYYDEGYTVRRAPRAYDDDFGDTARASASARREPRRQETSLPARTPSRFSQDAVAAVAPPAPRAASSARTVMFSITSLEECCEVIDALIANNIVLITLDELDARLTQRAVDTLSGAVFALHATIRKASDKTYLIAPRTVEVNETYDVERRF
jgi:FtsZ-interacting cell division protein YlmF